MTASWEADFYGGIRSPAVPFVANDDVRVMHGEYAGRVGAVISPARPADFAVYVIEFGDGTDAEVPARALELLDPAV